MNEKNIKYANSQYDQSSPDKEPFNYILWGIKNEEERIWNSSELHQEYLKKGGTESKVSRLSDTDQEENIKRVAERISSKIKEVPVIKDSYPTLDEEEISDLCLTPLLSMLSIMSPKFQSNLQVVALMRCMIKTVMTWRVSIL